MLRALLSCACISDLTYLEQDRTGILFQGQMIGVGPSCRLMKVRAEHVSHVGACQLDDVQRASHLTISAATNAATWHTFSGSVYSAPGGAPSLLPGLPVGS